MEKPQDLIEIEKAIKELNDYKTAINSATFRGQDVKSVARLQGFIQDSYEQLLQKVNNHPWVMEVRAQAAKSVPNEEV